MLRFVIVCEGQADRRTATRIADRVLDRAGDWTGLDPGASFLPWRDVRRLADKKSIRSHGHFGGVPAEPDAHAAHKAILLAMAVNPKPDAVVLIRDADNDPRRRLGLEQARSRVGECPVVIGVAEQKREAWLIAGFEPKTPAEEKLLASMRKGLGFDPRARPQDLTAMHDPDKRSAKRVCSALCGGDTAREDACIDDIPLDDLYQRGKGCGLAALIDDVRTRLCPVLGVGYGVR